MVEKIKGSFMASLVRNNKQIKKDRAAAIAEEAQITYKRHLEDIGLKIKRKKRQLENMLDMSPENSMSLIVAEKFAAAEFVTQRVALLEDIRNLEITYELIEKDYKKLFEDEEEEEEKA